MWDFRKLRALCVACCSACSLLCATLNFMGYPTSHFWFRRVNHGGEKHVRVIELSIGLAVIKQFGK